MLPLCPSDPVLDALRAAFPDANVLRRPQRRVRPLTAFAVPEPARLRPVPPLLLDDLLPLLAEPTVQLPGLKGGPSPRFTATRTAALKHETGLRFLSGFLEGMGVDPELFRSAFDGADTLSFDFQGVKEQWVPLSELGQALAGARLDPDNVATPLFLQAPRHQLAVVDSVLTSNAFVVQAGARADASFDLRLPVQEAVAKIGARVQVKLLDERTLRFAGSPALTFAFTAVALDLGPDGQIRRLRRGEPMSFSPPGEAARLSLWPSDMAGDIYDEPSGA